MAKSDDDNPKSDDKPQHNRPDKYGEGDKSSKVKERASFSRTERATGSKATEQPAEKLNAQDKSKDRNQRLTRDASGFEKTLETLERAAREYLCKKGFGSHFRPTEEPREKEFDRGEIERTADWMGLDSFMSERPVGDWGKFVESALETKELGLKLQDAMLKESTNGDGKIVDREGRDKYYHCMFNCVGNSKGAGGEVAAAAGSMAKEIKDVAKVMLCKDWSYKAATRDSMRDQAANRLGRDAGRSGLRCSDACESDRTAFIKNMFR